MPPKGTTATSYKWRGKGWLKIASSKWQVLGYGEGWAVTYFAATLFTPAGVDIYSRTEEGISKELYNDIYGKLRELDGDFQKLAEALFEVKRGD